MEKRKIGSLEVSLAGLGCNNFGWRIDADATLAVVNAAIDAGINLFDTADVYQGGQAEEIVGTVLQSIPRHAVVVATKLGFGMDNAMNGRGSNRKHVMEACHASLRRLKTDYIDLYQLHYYDAETPLDETCRAFDDLCRQGKVLYWGISNWSGHQIKEAVALCQARGYDQPASLQPRYNMFARQPEKDELIACAANGLGVIVYSPLAQGLLTGKYVSGTVPSGSRADNNPDYRKRFLVEYNQIAVKELQELAASVGMPLSRLALAWVLSNKDISSAIVGATSPAQLEENVSASGVTLNAELLAKIQKILDRRWALVLEDDAKTLRAGAV